MMPSITLFGLFVMMLLCIGFANSYYVNTGSFEDSGSGSKPTVSYKYDRIGEVNKECASVLQSAPDLKPDDSRLYTIKEELSFLNGDWWQDLNGAGAPLMPFDDRELSSNPIDLRNPLNLVSFWVTDVDRHHHSKNSLFISGTLQMGITLNGLLSEKPYEGSPRFDIWPGQSQLSINFQGIYTESEKNHGERVMCLLGNTVLPSRQPDSGDPWGWVKESGYTNQPILTQDDQIILVLRYPRTLTLTSRAIHGSMKSLNPKSNLKYFDEVRMSSWLSTTNYQFTSETLVSKACDPYPFKDDLMNGDIDVYKGLDFCVILERFTHQEALTILPNWKCNGPDEFCSKLGPFVSDKEINATDGSFENVKLVLQNVRCENITSKDNAGSMRVSSLFRAVPPSENRFTAAQRTGLSNMTLSAEGIWKSSSGQLCMVGCSAYADADGQGCDTRICMYVPLLFSVKQRSILLGTLSSIDRMARSYFPLTFEKLVRPAELWDQYTASHPYYKYSKINTASAVLEKYEPFNIGTVIKKSLMKFPKIEDMGNLAYSTSLLSEDLTLHIPAVPDPVPSTFFTKTDVEMEILSIGTMLGRDLSAQFSNFQKENPYPDVGEYTEKQLLLNVSGQLKLMGIQDTNFSSLFVEGIYDPHVGKMYLVGCRDVRASWKTLYESMDLEAGLDCLVEAVISYPPTTSRWLVNPTAKISITSQRNEDDPLYFVPIKLQTVPVMYRKQREDILSRRGVEGILRILTLSLAIACISSQLFYIRDNMESVPYISLVMLGVQALGYSLPLITGAEAFFKKAAATGFSENQSYDLQNSQWIHVIDYTVKLLVLVAFSVTLRVCQKVWKSRIKMLTRAPLEPYRVPSDKRVLFATLIIHVVGYVLVLVVHFMNTSHKPLQTSSFIDSTGYSHAIREWETELVEYLGLIQDFFLLPQVIGNLLWRIHVKPLRKLYYIGITSVRLLPHIYDYIGSPIPNPYFSEEYEFVNPRMDFYSKFGDIAIPTIAVLLAFAVYVQQRWNYEKLSQTLVLGQRKLLPLGSKVYERLPSVSLEAELASGVNKNFACEKEHDQND